MKRTIENCAAALALILLAVLVLWVVSHQK